MARVSIFWFRRDLRLEDNLGLNRVICEGRGALFPVFIFDPYILSKLPRDDRRVHFLHDRVVDLKSQLGGNLQVFFDEPQKVFANLLLEYGEIEIYLNKAYDPYGTRRDLGVKNLVGEHNWFAFNDFTLHDDIKKPDGTPYQKFTPYKKAWLSRFSQSSLKEAQVDLWGAHFHKDVKRDETPSLERVGFKRVGYFVEHNLSKRLVSNYGATRDRMDLEGTSRVSVFLRFGLLSVRQIVKEYGSLSDAFLNELIWREFYIRLIKEFPEVVSKSFQKKYKDFPWRRNKDDFDRWSSGTTGFPVIDAAMRQLNQTGWMHNRARMIVANFLTRHLLIHYKWGEKYFALKLMDYELSSNNGGWQWAAGVGVDAAPYFRIFNPHLQQKKFDPKGEYCSRWIEELGGAKYPSPMISHQEGRERALNAFKSYLDFKM